MNNNENPRKNAEGYSDLTAYEAIKSVEKEKLKSKTKNKIVYAHKKHPL